jgi:hypothetical protein
MPRETPPRLTGADHLQSKAAARRGTSTAMGFEHFILQLLKSHRGRMVVALLSVGASGLFALFAWPNVADARKLWQRHQFCTADVIEHRYSSGMHYFDGDYDLRYSFRLAPHGRMYQQSDKGPLSRSELWSSLPKDKWLEAVRSGTVSVAYCIDDPSINAIDSDLASGYRTLLIFSIVAGSGLFASSLWLVWLIAKPRPALPGLQCP